MPDPAWTLILLFVLPRVAGMAGARHHDQSLVEMSSYFPRLALNCGPLDLCLLSRLELLYLAQNELSFP
jgi:hypothetical protein